MMTASKQQLSRAATSVRRASIPPPRRTAAGSVRGDANPTSSVRSHHQVAAMVDRAIVPRLVIAGRFGCSDVEEGELDDPRVVRLSNLVRSVDGDETLDYVDELAHAGVGPDGLCLEVLAPTARRLGRLWVDDLCHFSEVTIGVSRLQHVVHRLLDPPDWTPVVGAASRRIVLLPFAGGQHTFGLSMVAAFFRRAGWEVATGEGLPPDRMLRLVRRRRFDVVGISVSCDHCTETLGSFVRALRRRSRNPDIGVLAGGSRIVARPELARVAGADAMARDGRHAVEQAERLLSLQDSPGRFGVLST